MRRILDFLSAFIKFSDFLTRMSEKGLTEPGWRIQAVHVIRECFAKALRKSYIRRTKQIYNFHCLINISKRRLKPC